MNRNIVVKTFFNPDEYVQFKHHCEANGLTHSSALRILSIGWLNGTSNSSGCS